MSYTYDSQTHTDNIRLENGTPLKLKESSSGIQSLLPMYVHLDYLTAGQYNAEAGKMSYEQKEERKNLLSTIYANLYEKDFNHDETIEVVTIDGVDYSFSKPDQAKKFKSICQEYFNVDHSEIFLEEPEDNLFPPTQCQFLNWMLEQIKTHGDMLFITTHSPYVLNQLIKAAPKELSVMFTHPQKPASRDFSVKQRRIVGKIKDGIEIEADVKYLSGAMDKIERMESYESYGTPFVVSEWCRFLTQCEVNT